MRRPLSTVLAFMFVAALVLSRAGQAKAGTITYSLDSSLQHVTDAYTGLTDTVSETINWDTTTLMVVSAQFTITNVPDGGSFTYTSPFVTPYDQIGLSVVGNYLTLDPTVSDFTLTVPSGSDPFSSYPYMGFGASPEFYGYGFGGHLPSDGGSYQLGPYQELTGRLASNGNYILADAVPEPASITLLGIGIATMADYSWRRRKRAVA